MRSRKQASCTLMSTAAIIICVMGHAGSASAQQPTNPNLGSDTTIDLSGILKGNKSSKITAVSDGIDYLSPSTGCALSGCALTGGLSTKNNIVDTGGTGANAGASNWAGPAAFKSSLSAFQSLILQGSSSVFTTYDQNTSSGTDQTIYYRSGGLFRLQDYTAAAGGADILQANKQGFKIIPPLTATTTTAPLDATVALATNAAVQANINCRNLYRYGAVGDGNTYNDAVWAAALKDLGVTGGCLYVPRGVFRFQNGAAFTFSGTGSLKITGDGPASLLQFASGGLAVNFNASYQQLAVEDVTIATEQMGTSNGLSLNSTVCEGGAGTTVPNYIKNVTLRGNSDGAYWASGINVIGASYFNYGGLSVIGAGQAGNGVSIAGNPSGCGTDKNNGYAIWHNFDGTSFYGLSAGINVGDYTQGIVSHKHNIIGTNYGVYIPAGLRAQGNVQIDFADGDIEPNISAVYIGSPYKNLFIHDNVGTVLPNQTWVDVPAAQTQSSITNNKVSCIGNSAGIVMSGTTSYMTVTGNWFYGCQTGVNMGASVTHTRVVGNQFQPNSNPSGAHPVGLGPPAGSDVTVLDNSGYNPVGSSSAAYAPASGATYTANASPETHYLVGGTVTKVTLAGAGGSAICTSTPCMVQLGPNESMSVTYSVAPTDVKAVH